MAEISMEVHACPDKVGMEDADPDLLREMVRTGGLSDIVQGY